MNTLFISGGENSSGQLMNDCYTFNIYTHKLSRRENMNEARAFHCIQKIPFKIFAFGGGTQEKRFKPLACAEVYDVLRNSWKKLPDMPKAGRYNTCVAV